MEEKGNTDGRRESKAGGRQRRFSDGSSSSGRGSGTSTEGFGIEQYCTVLENAAAAPKVFSFPPNAFPDPFRAKCNNHDINFFSRKPHDY